MTVRRSVGITYLSCQSLENFEAMKRTYQGHPGASVSPICHLNKRRDSVRGGQQVRFLEQCIVKTRVWARLKNIKDRAQVLTEIYKKTNRSQGYHVSSVDKAIIAFSPSCFKANANLNPTREESHCIEGDNVICYLRTEH